MQTVMRPAASGTPTLAREEGGARGVRRARCASGTATPCAVWPTEPDQQDAVQETFLRAWRARDRYDPQMGGPAGWFFTIARNVVIDLHRAHGVRPWLRSLADHETLTQMPASAPQEWGGLMHRWLVEEALRRLGDDHRRALEQTYLADRPDDEVVAAEVGISASTSAQQGVLRAAASCAS